MRPTQVLILLPLLTAAATLTAANPIDGVVYVDTGDGDQPYRCPTPDPLNIIDRTCSANDDCGGAEVWPLLTVAKSTGNVGGTGDPRDWSSVDLYRTETLVLKGTEGLVIGSGIGCSTSIGSSLYASQNGWYDLKVSSDVHAPYTLEYEVLANDALSGKDAGSTFGDANFISAVPRSVDPWQLIVYKGSLPNRDDLGPDQDWYRIGTNLAALSDPTRTEGPAIGLLKVTFNADCNGGEYTFDFYGPDGLFPIGSTRRGCGPQGKSCITSGVFPVTARFAVSGRGTGYDFTADLVPLYLVDLNDGVLRTYLEPSEPFCDVLTPAALEALGWAPGANVGVVNTDGVVVARTQVH